MVEKWELLESKVTELGFDYQRMSTSGQETYDIIVELMEELEDLTIEMI